MRPSSFSPRVVLFLTQAENTTCASAKISASIATERTPRLYRQRPLRQSECLARRPLAIRQRRRHPLGRSVVNPMLSPFTLVCALLLLLVQRGRRDRDIEVKQAIVMQVMNPAMDGNTRIHLAVQGRYTLVPVVLDHWVLYNVLDLSTHARLGQQRDEPLLHRLARHDIAFAHSHSEIACELSQRRQVPR